MLKEELEQQNNHGLTKDNQKIQAFDKFDHCCFVGGALVHAERGLVQLQDIKIGGRVLSADPITGQQSYQAVTKVIKTENQPVIFIEFRYQIDSKLSLF
ncbi:hypothetical protein [Acinetobacter sp.]|jgi:hypothetical protein|uniref:hypothetical protein n=1 Tax=Acinetobacter sp. TaxID=472 RepID=UPI0035B4B462